MARRDRGHCPISFSLSGRQMWGPFLPRGSLCLACSGQAPCPPETQIKHLIPREGSQRQGEDTDRTQRAGAA